MGRQRGGYWGLSVLLSGLLGTSVWAGAPPSEPQLRLEVAQHTAVITRIGVDAANRFLVTGSHDKTARIWDLATGRLLRTLRPPIGSGAEGKVYAVAISPDGQTVAVGGYTGLDFDGKASIYLFDRASGQLIRRLPGLPEVILHLAYAPDGQRLVATLGGKNGIRVYRTSDDSLLGEDRDYGADSYGAAFDRAGRLVTTSWDGFVRLYDAQMRLVARQQAPGGTRPGGVAFSPDGAQVAVGFEDATKVAVLSGQDLSFRFAPSAPDVRNQNLGNVAWSADGQKLYAAGTYQREGSRVIRVWEQGGQGPFRDLPAANNTIFALVPLQAGGVAYGAGGPAFGIFDAQGRKTLFQGPVIADYRGIFQGAWGLSSDGAAMAYGYEPGGKAPASFAIAARAVTVGTASGASAMAPPRTSAPGLTVTNWEDTLTPTLNGQPLQLEQHETSRSVAVTPDGQSVLLGTEWWLRLFDRTGRQLWRVPVPGAAWGVNVAGNGQVAVAALADGTIRWYRLRDGQELLAFFPHTNTKDWVLWTPTGYYDASPGGDDLLGWHVNQGQGQAADFFPAAQFRSTYYRPDVVAAVLETLDEGAAVRRANSESGRKAQTVSLTQQVPPVVTILSPADGAVVNTAEVTVRFSIRSPSGEPVTGIKALVDGRPVAAQRGVQVTAGSGAGEEARELRVPIPAHDAEIAILAENKYAPSVPAVVRVRWQGAGGGARARDEFVAKPKLYVLAVGVSQYQHKDFTLGFPAKDAQDFVTALQTQQGRLYQTVTAKVLTDAKATKDEILDGLDWLQKETTSKDVAMLFLAGHGVNDQAGVYYFLPTNGDPEKLKRTGVVFSDIKNTLSSLAGKALFFVDTCHAGNIMGARRGGVDINAVVNELASAESGAVVFASSTGRQSSLEHPDWGNGAFTKAVVEGLSGKADLMGKGKITVNMLDAYIAERVKELTKGQQTPTTTKPHTVPDFPVAVMN